MDQELIAYLDKRFGQIDARFEQLEVRLDRVEQRLDGLEQRLGRVEQRLDRVEEAVRHTGVEMEGLHAKIQLLAEGMISFDQRLTTFREDMTREFESVRALIRPAYDALGTRVRTLEVWRETKERDPIEIIKERFGLGGPRTVGSG